MGDQDPEPLKPSIAIRLGWLGIASAALDLTAVYWKTPAIRPGVTCGDLVDVLTPVLLVLLYALVLRQLPAVPASDRRPRLLFMIGCMALLIGHGIHVAANSIHDAIDRAGLADPGGLVNWWDEHVSHYAVHGAKALLCVALTAMGAGKNPSVERRPLLFWIGALAYGFIVFTEGVEGQTVPLVLPFVVLYLAWSLGRGRPLAPVRLFYTLAALVSILLFAYWGIAHRGFPEFSQVGLIPRP
ncbi:MAG TPA: hypothetical protein VE402_01635 [Candidatus Angelobacter sp.]|nr:hypothetical protein [Candidatus Angelobacter sp.]